MLGRRIAVAIIGIPILIGLLYAGNLIFASAVGLIILLSLVEFYRLVAEIDIKANLPLGLFFAAFLPVIVLYYGTAAMIAWLTAAVFLALFWKIFFPQASIAGVGITLLGIFYVGLLSHLVLIDKLPQGKLLVIFTFVATWIADTAAYAVGRLAGRRPLAARISPKKTLEGLVGAIIINLVLFAFLKWVPGFSLGGRLLFAFAVTITATLGDLTESAFKREAGVKDSGNLIPGHGGFLDRFDSMIFTAAAAYYLIRILGG